MNQPARLIRGHVMRWLATALTGWAVALGAVAQPVQGSTAIARTPTGPVAMPHRVEVFANSAMLLTHADGATVYLLDGLQLLEAQLSQGLPTTESEATRVARERMQRLGNQVQARAANAAQGMALAAQYGIDRIPAVVIDGRAIVYGVTDVQKAVAAYALRQESAR